APWLNDKAAFFDHSHHQGVHKRICSHSGVAALCDGGACPTVKLCHFPPSITGRRLPTSHYPCSSHLMPLGLNVGKKRLLRRCKCHGCARCRRLAMSRSADSRAESEKNLRNRDMCESIVISAGALVLGKAEKLIARARTGQSRTGLWSRSAPFHQ